MRRKTDGGNSNLYEAVIFDKLVSRRVDPGGAHILDSGSLGSKQDAKKFAALFLDSYQILATSNHGT